MLTAVRHQLVNKSALNTVIKQRAQLAQQVEQDLNVVLIISNKLLRDEHTEAWKQVSVNMIKY